MSPTERELIESIKNAVHGTARNARIGIGDDCAVFFAPAGREAVITTDFSLENVHFRREWHPARSVGHRCLARGLSDIAAMGATPVLAFLSVAIPRNCGTWLRGFMRGLLSLAGRYKVELAGGDTAESPHGICADIMVVGISPRKRTLLRSGARPGDSIYVTGELGGSAATLALLRNGRKPRPQTHRSHFYPAPRIEVGQILRKRNLATAAIDLSDGLSTDLSHICEESGVRARVYAQALPVARAAGKGCDALSLALHGGEDYELLFTARAGTLMPSSIAGIPVHRIGEILAARDAKTRFAKANGKKSISPLASIVENGRETDLTPKGWEHFS